MGTTDKEGLIIAGSTFRKPPEIVSVFRLRANGLLTNTKLALNVYNRGVIYKFCGLSLEHLNSHFNAINHEKTENRALIL